MHKTTHWTWAFDNALTGEKLGKKNVVNNFCVATATNWPRCTSCHIGYGWKDDKFDLTSEVNVDCPGVPRHHWDLQEVPDGCGAPQPRAEDVATEEWQGTATARPVKVAQGVGKPGRSNCGACHFYGGVATG